MLQGASTRSLVLALPALQARALLHRRDHVVPDDLVAFALPIFEHRLVCRAGGEAAAQVVESCLGPIVDTLARASLRS